MVGRPHDAQGCLLDVEGVLVRDKRYEPIAGAVAWVEALVAADTPFCLVSNNTTHRPGELVARLQGIGFVVAEDQLVGALDLGKSWLRENDRRRIMWLGVPGLRDYWREQGFEVVRAASDAEVDAVVLGAHPALTTADLDAALPALVDQGADLLCLHRNLFYLDADGRRRLGPGVWAAGFEALGGPGRVVTVGKPSPLIYRNALERIGVPAAKTLFISDDPQADLVTASRLGMVTAFVLSGKYRDHEILGCLPEDDWPDIICARLADLEPPKRDAT